VRLLAAGSVLIARQPDRQVWQYDIDPDPGARRQLTVCANLRTVADGGRHDGGARPHSTASPDDGVANDGSRRDDDPISEDGAINDGTDVNLHVVSDHRTAADPRGRMHSRARQHHGLTAWRGEGGRGDPT
jgi:hypothetical protein